MASLRHRVHEIIFEADTPAGKTFDVVLLVAILVSVVVVMLDSVAGIQRDYHDELVLAEFVFTALFTVEYILRLICVRKPLGYATSFFGVIDLLSILPTYLSLVIPGAQHLLVLRMLRLLRIFRVLKLVRYVGASDALMLALRASRLKITVFICFVFILVTILGSIMYLVEGETGAGNPQFANIPESIYWAVVTLSTVGYGDMVPLSAAGKMISTVVMLLGYGIIAVPTGIVSAEMVRRAPRMSTETCPHCCAEGHPTDARYCYTCGEELNPREV